MSRPDRRLPPALWVAVVSLSFLSLAAVFVTGLAVREEVWARVLTYTSYTASAYALTLLTVATVRVICRVRRAGWGAVLALCPVRWFSATRFGGAYLSDRDFRRRVGGAAGAVTDLAYTVFRVVTGILYGSVWFLSLAAYHFLLGVLRACLLPVGNPARTTAHRAWRAYRRVALLLLCLDVPMGGVILLTVLTDAGFSYPGYVIYLSAMYTFYKSITAGVELWRYRRAAPVRAAAVAVNFSAALMSVLALQTAMISAFSPGGQEDFRRTMNTVTGTVVYLAVLALAVFMLLSRRRAPEEPKTEESCYESLGE